MSEGEVHKHVRRAYKIWRNPAVHWKEKIFEIFIEILIIVFAVSLSLYLERWREKSHDRQIEKHFLTGLKNDLQNDITELTSDAEIYHQSANAFKYFYSTNHYSPDSIRFYRFALVDFTQLIPNTNRYEALKSSGKLDVIENVALMDSIVDLYQDKIPGLIEVFIKPFNEFRWHELFSFLDNHLVTDSDGNQNFEEVLHLPVAKNYLSRWDYLLRISERYHMLIDASNNIIHQIDEELK
jgi:hypothetical protein